MAEAMELFNSIEIDISKFKFDRSEANERQLFVYFLMAGKNRYAYCI